MPKQKRRLRQNAGLFSALPELLSLNALTNIFRAMPRSVWFKGVRGKERNGEHSFQLALMSWYLNERLALGLRYDLILMYALVHDFPEVYAGDTPAFPGQTAERKTLTHRTKRKREHAAVERLREEWGDKFPSMIIALDTYKQQADEESRFVNALDKLITTINVYQDNGRAWHLLGVSLKTLDAYKRRRVSRHAIVARLYQELRVLLEANPKLFPKRKRRSQ